MRAALKRPETRSRSLFEPVASDDAQWEAIRLAEALLFATAEPMSAAELAGRLPRDTNVEAVLDGLVQLYAGRGVNLIRVAGGWAFRTAVDLSTGLGRGDEPAQKLSRAALEVLAIVAYHQPTTRAEIEEIRGVTTSKGTIDLLIEAGWVRPRARRRTPGRPVTYGTTPAFLSQFGLDAIADLPGLEELKGLGFLEGRVPTDVAPPAPSDDPALWPDEETLEPDLLSLTPYGSEGSREDEA